MVIKKNLIIVIVAIFIAVAIALLVYSNLKMQLFILEINKDNINNKNESMNANIESYRINANSQDGDVLNICAEFCSNAPIDITHLDNKNCSIKKVTKESYGKLTSYFFCKGVVDGDANYACSDKIYSSQEEKNVCKHGFYSLSAILFHKLGKKEEAKKYCLEIRRTSGDNLENKICDEFVNTTFNKLLDTDFCSNFSEKNENLKCKAMISGDKTYCDGLTKKDFIPDCISTADFTKSLDDPSVECDKLFNPNINSYSVVACKLYFENLKEDVCKAEYIDFQKLYCAK